MSAQAHAGHTPQLDLLPTDATGTAPLATHVAINHGDWFDPGTWASGTVPGEGAIVQIPDGVAVSYDGASDAGLFIVRVDGALSFNAEDGQATKMVVDTIVTAPGSILKINAADDTDGTVDIVFDEGQPAAHAAHFTTGTPGDGVMGRFTWDPEQLSLGLVAGGDVEIRGQTVDAGLNLAVSPSAGDTQLIFDSDGGDFGWQPGHLITIGDTGYLGRGEDGSLISQNEVRTITDVQIVDGKMIVSIDQALDFDHDGRLDPTTGEELTGYVGNVSRNVTFSSAAADQNGDGIPEDGISLGQPLDAGEHYVTERGHIMFMHNDDVTVSHTSFLGLGRTDKTREIDDFKIGGIGNNRLFDDNGTQGVFEPGVDVEIETPADQIVNQRGRYAVHIHEARKGDGHDDDANEFPGGHTGHGVIGPCPETGGSICHCGDSDHSDHGAMGPCPETGGAICHCDDQDGDGTPDHLDDDYFDGAWIEGIAVFGSPGWGLVQHSSDAVLKDNVVYGVSGSAYVAESGDETGRWEGNLAMNSYGKGHFYGYEDSSDFNENGGGEGNGFYLKARAIEVVDNVAQSSARAGFFYHNNGTVLRDTPTDDLDVDGFAHGLDFVDAEDVPIRTFEGNEAIGAEHGIRIVTDPLDAMRKFSDAYSHFKDFTGWELDEAGVSITYSSKYVFEDFLLLGTEEKVSQSAVQDGNIGFFLKASVADITILNSHVEYFENSVHNWTQVGNRQEYRRGYWDPKGPSGYQWTPEYEGMGSVEGIENPMHNLWNTNLVGVTASNLSSSFFRAPAVSVETDPGVTEKMRGTIRFHEDADSFTPGVEIELLGDSRDGALVALWREDLANHPDQAAILANHIPLAYQESRYLSKVFVSDTEQIKRQNYLDYEPNINADIWSGTVLEFAKEDSLGRQVFLYEDFSPLAPAQTNRAVTTNERLIFTKEMIGNVLKTDGFYRVGGISDVKFVIMKMAFTDRLSGEIEAQSFLVALDLSWPVPKGARDNGIVHLGDDLIVAEQYRVFRDGVLVSGRAPIVLSDAPPESLDGTNNWITGAFTTELSDDLRLGALSDTLDAGGGDDIVRGFAAADYLNGEAGNDQLFGGNGWDRLNGGEGDDLLDGHYQRDFLNGGAGNDILFGGFGRDDLDGGDGDDSLEGGNGTDDLVGGAGNDLLIGGAGKDTLNGGAGNDIMDGGAGQDRLLGDIGDDVLLGSGGKDTLFGGDGDDMLDGGAKADQLFGGAGQDQIAGGTGRDNLFGGDGDDHLEGQAGHDLLLGESGTDTLFGGAGDDTLEGGDGADILLGGTGKDRMTGGQGADRFVFEESPGMDVITDFEDGVDAIEFMIEAFGFEDLDVLQDGDDAVVSHAGGSVRLLDVNALNLDASDFEFGTSPLSPMGP